ncbi:MAG: hypothetical protein ACYS0H_18705 [Planctomycetota bacterium]|jgi:hypothetical protein
MKNFQKTLEHYPELDDRLRAFADTEFKIEPRGFGIEIIVPHASSTLRLNKTQLQTIEAGYLVDNVRKLKYHRDCGISFDSYSEFFVTIEHPQYVFLDLPSDWPSSIPLKFRVGDVSVVVGDASPLIVLLMESHYCDSDVHPDGFSSLATIRLHGVEQEPSEKAFHKALYYVNSHYFKPVGLVASLRHLETDFDDPLGIFYGATEPEEAFKKIVRRRIRTRDDFTSTEPLILYNHACISSGNESFISYYRVLEFFFMRAILANIEILRNDPSANAQDILDNASARNEEQQLRNLIANTLTPSQKKKLFEYAKSQNLIKDANLHAFVTGLYTFRNSLVHAKEKQLQRTTLPDPFITNSNMKKWTYIVAACAERAIRQFREN